MDFSACFEKLNDYAETFNKKSFYHYGEITI